MAGVVSSTASGAAAGSAFGPWGTVIGAGVGLVGGLLNKKKAPQAVPYDAVNPQAEQQRSIAGNTAALPDLETLLKQANGFQQGQATGLMEKALPGYSKFAGALTKTATGLAENPYEVPKSVVDQLSQYAAEHNISAGTGAASGFSSSNLLRSLGVNALQYGQTNLNSAMQALSVLTGTAPRTSPMSPMSFLVSPEMQIQNQVYTNTQRQKVGQGGANANTGAANWNSENLWDSATSAAGMLGTEGGAFDHLLKMFSNNPKPAGATSGTSSGGWDD